MYLVGPDTVANRLTLSGSIGDFNRAIQGALRMARSLLETQLDTTFDRVSGQQDVFQITRVFNVEKGTPRFDMRLSRGFLTGTTEALLAVRAAPTLYKLLNGTDGTDRQNLRDHTVTGYDYVRADTERGVVSVLDYDVINELGQASYVSCTYTHGFTVDTDEEYESVPSWLQDYAYLTAAYHVLNNPIIRTTVGDTDNLQDRLNDVKEQLKTMDRNRRRYYPSAFRPLPG